MNQLNQQAIIMQRDALYKNKYSEQLKKRNSENEVGAAEHGIHGLHGLEGLVSLFEVLDNVSVTQFKVNDKANFNPDAFEPHLSFKPS